jgi:hypothetical protein
MAQSVGLSGRGTASWGGSGGPTFTPAGSSEAIGLSAAGGESAAGVGKSNGVQGASLWTSTRPVPFVDDNHNQVLTPQGNPMMRPSDVDPHFFVDEGESTRAWTGLPSLAGPLSGLNFDRGGPWDVQRVGPTKQFVGIFTDFANTAIGLFGASARIPQGALLFMANQKAGSSHHSGPGASPAPGFSSLSTRDADDVRHGYELYNTHAIARSPSY